jgi:nitric oxide reductase NorD protein
MPSSERNGKAGIEEILDQILEVEFSFRNTSSPAESLVQLPPDDLAFILDWIRRVASAHLELGYQVACHGARALEVMDQHMIEFWVLHVMDTYDRQGLRPALQAIHEVDDFICMQHARNHGAILEEEEAVLLGFLHGLAGRKLKISRGESVYTDTETLFLPPIQSLMPEAGDNFAYYKITCAYLWAQIHFGTFRVEFGEDAADESLVHLFHAMDSIRIEARLKEELPGLYRDIRRLNKILGAAPLPEKWREITERHRLAECAPEQIMILARSYRGRLSPYGMQPYQGSLKPELAAGCMANRAQREKARFRVGLQKLLQEMEQGASQREGGDPSDHHFGKRRRADDSRPEGFSIDLLLDDMPAPLPDQMSELLSSIIVDFGDIPDDYLEAAGPGEYDDKYLQDDDVSPDDVWSGTYHEVGAFLYPEWDFQRKHYRKNWCAVRERTVEPVYDDFVESTLEKYQGLTRQLRKTFEAMRDEDRLLKRQPDGEGVDIDALVEALSDQHQGREMSDRLFTRMHRSERNIAVIFMVDMSGSTKGWINQAERESLVLLCEALETLGDRYAIYGFSSLTRKRCELFHVKGLDERYSDEVKARISGIEPKDYTRMGFAIRHLSGLLKETDARTKMLITLSDGKPDDYDSYRGVYGIEDTRRALIEARRDGVYPYCITIDEEARDYLPHLYGPAAFTLVDDVRKLPFRVSDIYRKLTTR